MIDKVIGIVKAAAAEMKTDHFEIHSKGDCSNIVTSSDISVQHYLTRELAALLPGSGFLCEEEDLNDSSKEYVWIIDPIDGTTNFARGIENCAIEVGLVRNGVPELGVVYSPARGELYSAVKGGGAFCNGVPIHASRRPFADSIYSAALCTYHKEYARICSDINYDVFVQCNDTRRFGSCAIEMCLMARGKIEMYFEMVLQPWDYAAAGLVLTEAGGAFAGLDGRMPSMTHPDLMAAANTPENLEKLLGIIRRHLPRMPY